MMDYSSYCGVAIEQFLDVCQQFRWQFENSNQNCVYVFAFSVSWSEISREMRNFDLYERKKGRERAGESRTLLQQYGLPSSQVVVCLVDALHSILK